MGRVGCGEVEVEGVGGRALTPELACALACPPCSAATRPCGRGAERSNPSWYGLKLCRGARGGGLVPNAAHARSSERLSEVPRVSNATP